MWSHCWTCQRKTPTIKDLFWGYLARISSSLSNTSHLLQFLCSRRDCTNTWICSSSWEYSNWGNEEKKILKDILTSGQEINWLLLKNAAWCSAQQWAGLQFHLPHLRSVWNVAKEKEYGFEKGVTRVNLGGVQPSFLGAELGYLLLKCCYPNRI